MATRVQASANQACRRRPFSSQSRAVSATTSAADHSSVPAIWRFNLTNLSSVQFAFESSRSKSRMAFRASPSVTPLPRKRSSSRCSRVITCRSSSLTSSPGVAAAPKSAAMRCRSSRQSGLCWPCAMRTRTAHFAAPKGLLRVNTWKRSFLPLKTCVCVVSCQPPGGCAFGAGPGSSAAPPSAASAPETTSASSSPLLSPLLSLLDAWLLPLPLQPSGSAGCGAGGWVAVAACCAPRSSCLHCSISRDARATTASSGCFVYLRTVMPSFVCRRMGTVISHRPRKSSSFTARGP
mmetsp:Transcript_96575/g.282292  ORF Transcript_96575/g.282292 Transcript_96575/m.282292 type:complete len:293 (-) Transcript_96575:87-965(-)